MVHGMWKYATFPFFITQVVLMVQVGFSCVCVYLQKHSLGKRHAVLHIPEGSRQLG